MSKRTHLSQILRLAGDNWSKSLVLSCDGLKTKTGMVCREVAFPFLRNVKDVTKTKRHSYLFPCMKKQQTMN